MFVKTMGFSFQLLLVSYPFQVALLLKLIISQKGKGTETYEIQSFTNNFSKHVYIYERCTTIFFKEVTICKILESLDVKLLGEAKR